MASPFIPLQIPLTATDPISGSPGQMIWNTTSGSHKVSDGVKWKAPAFIGTTTPATLTVGGTGSAGTAATAAASDHVHGMPGLATSSVSGFFAAADKASMVSLTAVTGLVKGNGAGSFSAGVANTDYLAVASPVFTGQLSGPRINASGSASIAAWNTGGAIFSIPASTMTDNTSSGTNANAQYVNLIGRTTIAASSATTYSNNIVSLYIDGAPIAGGGATFSGNTYALLVGSGNTRCLGLFQATAGALLSGANSSMNDNSNFTSKIGTGTSTGAVTLGGASNSVTLASPTINLSAVSTTTTAPAAGLAGALPALPTGYLTIQVAGTNRQIAYY